MRTGQTVQNPEPPALLPQQMARMARETGIAKTRMSPMQVFMLAILAGAFIAFGAVFSTLVTSGSNMAYGITKLLGGLAFSLGLILVVVGGAELFTGNNLLVMAWACREIRTRQVLYNWIIVYTGNLFGALSIVVLVILSGHHLSGNGEVAANMLSIAEAKCSLGFTEAVTRGILCNILVCLAIWLCLSARTTQGKILAIVFPITAFVAAGFEHSVANMYFIPSGIVVKEHALPDLLSAPLRYYESLTWRNFFLSNLVPVTLGNIIGGSLFVGLGYWFIYLRSSEAA